MAAGTVNLDSPPHRQSRMANAANRLGIAALIVPVAAFGLSFAGYDACGWSLLLFLLALPLSLAAAGLGFVALFRISRIPHLHGTEEATGGWKKGLGGLLLWILLLVLSPASKLPPCGERPYRNDPSAVGSLRTLNTACVTYATNNPQAGFPRALRQLGMPPSGEKEGPEYAGLIDNALASGRKSGYDFTYTPGKPDAKGVITTYAASARQVVFGKSGYRNYFTDETGVIRATAEDRDATPQDPPL